MKILFITLLLTFLSFSLYASDDAHMVSGGSSGSFLALGEEDVDIIVDFNVAYHRTLSPYFQLGIENQTHYAYRQSSSWSAFIAPSFIFNIPFGANKGLQDAFFFKISAGMVFTSTTSNEDRIMELRDNSFLGQFSFGKRFSLTKNISYSPHIGVYTYEKIYDTGIALNPYLTFLQFDLFF